MTRRLRPHPRLPAARLAALLLLLGPCPGHAAQDAPAADAPAPNYLPALGPHSRLHWKRMPVRLYFTPSPASTPERRAQARAGFDEWVRATSGVIAYRVADAPGQSDVSVTFSDAAFLDEHTHESGITALSFSGTTLRKADIQLAAGGTTPGQLQEVAAHEFGHALGINGHSPDPDDLMAPVQRRVYNADGTPLDDSAHPVTRRDLNTLKACYPALFAAPPPPAPDAPAPAPDPDSETVAPADASGK